MDANRQRRVVDHPQVLEHQFSDRARIDEDDGEPRLFEQPHHRLRRPAAIVPGPGHAFFGDKDVDDRISTGVAGHQPHGAGIGIGGEPALIGFGVGNGGAQPDAAQAGTERLQPRQGEAQLVAALGGGKGVNFIDDDGSDTAEHRRRVGVRDQQRQAFGRRQQDMWRAFTLAGLAIRRGITGARFDANVEPDLLDRIEQVARNIDRKCFQRRDVDGVQPLGRSVRQLGERRQEPGQRLARARRGDEQRADPVRRRRKHFELMPPGHPPARGEPCSDGGGKTGGHVDNIGVPKPPVSLTRSARFPPARGRASSPPGRPPAHPPTAGTSSAPPSRVRTSVRR